MGTERIPVAKTTKKADKQTKKSGGTAFKVMDKAGVLVTSMIVPPITAAVWRLATRHKPPADTRHPRINTREAVAWAVFAGVSTEVVKLLIRREAAQYWERSTGEIPPGLKDIEDDTSGAGEAPASRSD